MENPRSFVDRALQRWFRRPAAAMAAEGCEQPPEWYDTAFAGDARADYNVHYSQSNYYSLWTDLVRRIPPQAAVLEIGCGPGQLAEFVKERRIAGYVGFDFSSEAIAMARERNPSLTFHVANALDTKLLDREDYDVVICTEVLEHINDDLKVLARVRSGVRCLVTVPNFPYVSHVRHFECTEAVSARYGVLFAEHRVDEWRVNSSAHCYFLLDGVRNGTTL